MLHLKRIALRTRGSDNVSFYQLKGYQTRKDSITIVESLETVTGEKQPIDVIESLWLKAEQTEQLAVEQVTEVRGADPV